ncbi:MAG TPA: hypothetical protein VMF10_04120 [Candidatus Aquilonibacter sp.]|nr:hypothetical protein [Candidatus Aquilonibacter sp.]
MRLKVSRHEIPASSRILVCVLEISAQFPRLPLASIDTLTHMSAAYVTLLWIRECLLSYPAPLNTTGFRDP